MAYTYALRAQYVATYSGGTIAYGPYGASFNIGAALTAGGGTITTSDASLIRELDAYPPLFRSGSTGTPVPEISHRYESVSAGNGLATSEIAMEVRRNNEAYPRWQVLADGTTYQGNGAVPLSPFGNSFATAANLSVTNSALALVDSKVDGIAEVVPAPTGVAATDTAAALNAIATVASSGGVVRFAAGDYLINATLPLYNGVILQGAGIGATVLKLANGSNVDLVATNGFVGLTGGGTQGGPSRFGVWDMALDGNRANNSSGWPLRIYGKAYRNKGLLILNGASGSVWSEWGTGTAEMGARWEDFFITDSADGTNGLHWLGPHDSQFLNGEVVRSSATSGGKGIFIDRTKNGYAGIFTNVHVWGKFANCWEVGRQAHLANCQGEGASAINLLIAAVGTTVEGGMYFGTAGVNGANEIGIQVGDATTGVSHCVVDTYVFNFTTTGVPLRFENDFGYNQIRLAVKGTTQTNTITGTISGNSTLDVVSDAGITNNHTRKHLGVPASNVDVRGRLILTSTTPTIAAAGNFASAAAGAAGASETAASLTATAHASAPTAGGVATVTFATAWSRTPRFVSVEAQNVAAHDAGLYVSAKSTAAVTVSCKTAPAAGAVLTFDVLVIG